MVKTSRNSNGNMLIVAASIFIIIIILAVVYFTFTRTTTGPIQNTTSTTAPSTMPIKVSTSVNSSYHQSNASACTSANPNYECYNALFNQTNHTLRIGLMQSTGANWTNTAVTFVPKETPQTDGIPNVYFNNSYTTLVGNMSGSLGFTCPQNAMCARSATYVTIQINPNSTSNGVLTGSVWAKYQVLVGGQPYYADFGNLTLT